MNRYAVGVDFGSLSGRAVVLDLSTGEVKAGALYEYPHGVMDSCLPDGTPLGDGWALQHPQDYLDVLSRTVPQALREAGVKGLAVVRDDLFYLMEPIGCARAVNRCALRKSLPRIRTPMSRCGSTTPRSRWRTK